jgi:hypothetical protein
MALASSFLEDKFATAIVAVVNSSSMQRLLTISNSAGNALLSMIMDRAATLYDKTVKNPTHSARILLA